MNSDNKKQQLFKLFPNKVLWVGAWSMHVTNGNLTDELAIKLLKLNIKNIKNFEKYPSNYKDIVNGIKQVEDTTPPVDADVIIEGENVHEQKEIAPIVEKPAVNIDDVIKMYTKKEMIAKLNELGVVIEDEAINTKKELAQTLIAFQNKS